MGKAASFYAAKVSSKAVLLALEAVRRHEAQVARAFATRAAHWYNLYLRRINYEDSEAANDRLYGEE